MNYISTKNVKIKTFKDQTIIVPSVNTLNCTDTTP